MNPDQLVALQNYINAATAAYNSGNYTGPNGVSANLAAYYSLQAQAGRGYASVALGVINNSGVSGETANANLQTVAGVTPGTSTYAGLMLSLATSDNGIVQKNGTWPTQQQVDDYHYQDYTAAGLSPLAWGGAAMACYNIDWSGGAAEFNGQSQAGNLYQQNLTPAQANSSAQTVLTLGMVYSSVLPGYLNSLANLPPVQTSATPSFQSIYEAFQLGWKVYVAPSGQVTAQLNGVTLAPTDGANGTVNATVSPTTSSDSIPTITITAAPMTLWEKIQFDVDNFVDTLSGQVQAGATAVSNYFNSVISTLETAGSSGTGATLTDVQITGASGNTINQEVVWNGANPSGSGMEVVQTNGVATITNLENGNQIQVSGAVDTSDLQPGQPVAVSTAVGTYHIDPSTGDITDSGAVTATINGQTVTLLGLGGTSPFALISNDNSISTASAVSSNVLAYPRWSGAASMTSQPSSRRGGPCRISPVGGNRKARRRSSDRLCGFDVWEGRGDGGARCRAAGRDRSSGYRTEYLARAAVPVGQGRGQVDPSGRPGSTAISVAGHTRRLPVLTEAAKLSGKECRSAHRCRHDVSILVGGLG